MTAMLAFTFPIQTPFRSKPIGEPAMRSMKCVMAVGWLLVAVWMVAGVGVVIMGKGYAGTQGITTLMLALVCASVVLPRMPSGTAVNGPRPSGVDGGCAA